MCMQESRDAGAAKTGRTHWGSRTGFILAAAGSAVGLGNIFVCRCGYDLREESFPGRFGRFGLGIGGKLVLIFP